MGGGSAEIASTCNSPSGSFLVLNDTEVGPQRGGENGKAPLDSLSLSSRPVKESSLEAILGGTPILSVK